MLSAGFFRYAPGYTENLTSASFSCILWYKKEKPSTKMTSHIQKMRDGGIYFPSAMSFVIFKNLSTSSLPWQ